ncbi:MAG: ABC transporter permease [Thermogemmata sp.]
MSTNAAARGEWSRSGSGRRAGEMTDPPAVVTVRFHRFLPYWAVLQTDLRQTAQGWLFVLWIALVVIGVCGFFLYRVGVQQEAGLVQSAAVLCAEALRAAFLGSLAVVVILSVAAISSERGTVADAVLSRGISRHQYFLARQHARVILVGIAFALISTGIIAAGSLLFRGEADISLSGAAVVIGLLSLLLAVVAAVGVVLGALTNSAVLGITIYWLLLYGGGLLLMLAPESWPGPERELTRLRYVLQGYYSAAYYGRIALTAIAIAFAATICGLIGFSRKDV